MFSGLAHVTSYVAGQCSLGWQSTYCSQCTYSRFHQALLFGRGSEDKVQKLNCVWPILFHLFDPSGIHLGSKGTSIASTQDPGGICLQWFDVCKHCPRHSL